MEPQDLLKVWDIPDYGKLAPKQVSMRIPILMAAKIAALCELYPQKTKTEIIVDLISTSLEQLEKSMPSKKGMKLNDEPDFPPGETPYNTYEDIGIKGKFHDFAEKHLRTLEKESGIEEPMPFKKQPYYEDLQ